MNQNRINFVLQILIYLLCTFKIAHLKVTLEYEEIVGGFKNPLALVAYSERDHLLIAEHYGRVKDVNLKEKTIRTILDMGNKIITPLHPVDERGLLGIALDPEEKFIYLSYSSSLLTPKTGVDHEHVLSRYKIIKDPEEMLKVDNNSEEIILKFDQPTARHNGGHIFFGKDGYLYVAIGDGNSENPSDKFNQTLFLGKLLRLNVSIPPYVIPDDNPFENEIFAAGFTNPWKCTEDRGDKESSGGLANKILKQSNSAGRLLKRASRIFCGDVGSSEKTEEIILVEKGGIYGWIINQSVLHPEIGLAMCNTKVSDFKFKLPIYSYSSEPYSVVIGGLFYRGDKIRTLKKTYVYADLKGTLHYLNETEGWKSYDIKLCSNNQLSKFLNFNILALGQDNLGHIYTLISDITKHTANGKLYKLMETKNIGSQPVSMSSSTKWVNDHADSLIILLIYTVFAFF